MAGFIADGEGDALYSRFEQQLEVVAEVACQGLGQIGVGNAQGDLRPLDA